MCAMRRRSDDQAIGMVRKLLVTVVDQTGKGNGVILIVFCGMDD